MNPSVASVYDQNPARIQLVAQRRRNNGQSVFQALIGIQLLVGLAAVLCWNFLPL